MRSRTAVQADEHVAPLPGTDAALALGLLHVVLQERAEDREYLEARTLRWEEFRARVLEFDPRRTAGETGVPEEEIVRLGRRIAHTRPTAIRVSQGIQRHAGAGTTVRPWLVCPPSPVTGSATAAACSTRPAAASAPTAKLASGTTCCPAPCGPCP
ncbi:molybdopterin-dependent oxidoreductase [Streptomyces clavuligerus]|uniref:molybdopterin-dependent oxidoreductase n=1 Tax=Streptomyces clavuligerus TaxID=1901 RepID=UPI001E4DD8CE|nr:molybdopterin-dependent oxidoreductase [Streptomyces clavuligerus]